MTRSHVTVRQVARRGDDHRPAAQAPTRRPAVATAGLQQELHARLLRAWDAETSFNARTWSAERPEKGQCAVTALVVQDLLGGVIVRAKVDGESHYWNVLDGGT